MARIVESFLGYLILIVIGLIIWGISSIRGCVEENKREKIENDEYEVAITTNTDSIYIAFMKEYSYGRYFKKVDSILWERTLNTSNYLFYIENVPKRYINEEHFIAAKDSLLQVEERKWNTDTKAWRMAQEINTVMSYKKYIEKYPNGVRIEQAKKNVIDKEVDDILRGDYGELPTMDKLSQGNGETSNISVYNNTNYTLTLRYSGIESRSFEIPSQSRQNILLQNGNYRIAASVKANVRSFAGTETLTGGSYDVTYYIVTTQY